MKYLYRRPRTVDLAIFGTLLFVAASCGGSEVVSDPASTQAPSSTSVGEQSLVTQPESTTTSRMDETVDDLPEAHVDPCNEVVDILLEAFQNQVTELGKFGVAAAAGEEPWDYIDVEAGLEDVPEVDPTECDPGWIQLQIVARSDQIVVETPVEAVAKATLVGPALYEAFADLDPEAVDRMLDLSSIGELPDSVEFTLADSVGCNDLSGIQDELVAASVAANSPLSYSDLSASFERRVDASDDGLPSGLYGRLESVRHRAAVLECDLEMLTEHLLLSIGSSVATGPMGSLAQLQALDLAVRWLAPILFEDVYGEIVTDPNTGAQLLYIRNDSDSALEFESVLLSVVTGVGEYSEEQPETWPGLVAGEERTIELKYEGSVLFGGIVWSEASGQGETIFISFGASPYFGDQ